MVSEMSRRVVVTGLGAITPIGLSVDEFWASVKEGKIGFGEITKFDSSDTAENYRNLLLNVVALGRALNLTPETELGYATTEFIKKCKDKENENSLSSVILWGFLDEMNIFFKKFRAK